MTKCQVNYADTSYSKFRGEIILDASERKNLSWVRKRPQIFVMWVSPQDYLAVLKTRQLAFLGVSGPRCHDLVSEVSQYHFCFILFIRSESFGSAHEQG